MAVTSQPQAGDLVLGGQGSGPLPPDALVLGGIPGWRRRLWHPSAEIFRLALAQAKTYGDAGRDVLIEALTTHPQWQRRYRLWQVLSQWGDPVAEQACVAHSPFRPVGDGAAVIRRYQRGERDFSYSELAGLDFRGARLGGMRLDYANARFSTWVRANLNGASLQHTDLRGADLRQAKLSGCNLQGADLRGSRLVGSKVSGVNWRHSRVDAATEWELPVQLIWHLQNRLPPPYPLVYADLSKADLTGLDFSGWDLSGANLTGTDLRQTALVGTILKQANLQRADLRGCDLRQADLQGSRLHQADLRSANLQGANLHLAECFQTDLRGVNLIKARLDGLKHQDTRVEGAIFPDGSRIKPWWW
ncbi:MAG: pentapeptide repeat-containing protein [Thermostichales cyanobacterium SZTDM-1c_bins_54]